MLLSRRCFGAFGINWPKIICLVSDNHWAQPIQLLLFCFGSVVVGNTFTSYLSHPEDRHFSPDHLYLVPDQELETPDHFLIWLLIIISVRIEIRSFLKWIRRFFELRIAFRIKFSGWGRCPLSLKCRAHLFLLDHLVLCLHALGIRTTGVDPHERQMVVG